MPTADSAHQDAAVVATGALVVLVGAVAVCSVEACAALVDVLAVKADVLLVGAVVLCRAAAMAAAPRPLAAPAPRVMADTQASPLSRADRRAEPEVGEPLMVLRSRIGGAGYCAVRGPCVHVPTLACAIFGCFL